MKKSDFTVRPRSDFSMQTNFGSLYNMLLGTAGAGKRGTFMAPQLTDGVTSLQAPILRYGLLSVR